MNKIPTLKESAEMMRHYWDDSSKRYPNRIYLETSNFCNAMCTYCLYDKMERPVHVMTLEEFKFIVNKVKKRGIKIEAMFCFGEPLADKGIFNKIRYGRSAGIFPSFLHLNTNVFYLTPDKYKDILETTNNITLSFVNTGEEFERLSGYKLKWKDCYQKAIDFIKYRDKHKPNFLIKIGCNVVKGHDTKKVEEAFKGYRVGWAVDAELRWSDKVLTGPLDRPIMHKGWRCDAHFGAMQVKPNGDLNFCAYDVTKCESKFANIFKDDWDTIEKNFKKFWKRPMSVCLRCDYWWNYYQMIAGGVKRGSHIDDSWQKDYLTEWNKFWEKTPGSPLTEDMFRYLEVDPKDKKILIIDPNMLNKLDTVKQLPEDTYDLIVSHSIAKHLNDLELINQLKFVIRSLKPDGILVIQFDVPKDDNYLFVEDLETQRQGKVLRPFYHMKYILEMMGGKIVHRCKRTDKWGGYHIKRVRKVYSQKEVK